MLEAIRTSLRTSFLRRHDSPGLLEQMLGGLDEDALYIGFARRFAPYKRAHLTFSDRERLRELLANSDKPVRLLVAGKAHPADQHGRDILQSIAEIARSEDFAGKVIFLEDYDMGLATSLIQGVDVWLNTPTRMLEASGTSGMKASANGGLNLSIADGWWDEAYDGNNGWRIGNERVYEDQDLQDEFDAASLYRLLEEEVVPLFYQRTKAGVPTGWMERVLHDLETIPAVFDTNRMVREYAEQAYLGQGAKWRALTDSQGALPRKIVKAHTRIRRGFEKLKVVEVRVADLSEIEVGDAIEAELQLDLGQLAASEICVELVLGHARGEHDLEQAQVVTLRHDDSKPGLFRGMHAVERSGSYAYGLRLSSQGVEDPGDSLRDLTRWV